MNRPDTDETDREKPRDIIFAAAQKNGNSLNLCGPGCSCGMETKNTKMKIVIMLIIFAVVAAALIYRRTL